MTRLSDFREILRYVPDFRNRVFVISIDGEIVDDPNFANILLDISLLHSLSIKVIIVHGASCQMRRAADKLQLQLSNDDGTGVTDPVTLDLATTVANRLTHQVLTGLASVDLSAACPNAVVAHPAGILKGVDMQFTGRVERVDVATIEHLLANRCIPVLPPLGFDGESQTYRLNSDALAVEVATALNAIKIVYVTPRDAILRSGVLQRQLTVDEARSLLDTGRGDTDRDLISKVQHACEACSRGVHRVHVISGRAAEGLLTEVFSNEGVGTLIYDDKYEVIRAAQTKDISVIQTLIKQAAEKDEVIEITRSYLKDRIDNFFVVEIDRNPVACAALYPYPEEGMAELASLVVGVGHENYGIGRRLIKYVEDQARQKGFKVLFCLSTQAFTYFRQKIGFQDATADDLPSSRRTKWSQSGRNSRILKKSLS